jgi:hypothetical protein
MWKGVLMSDHFPDCHILDMPQYREFPINLLNRLFTYHAGTGDLIWKTPPKNHPRMLNKKAGSLRGGYLLVQINGLKIGAHRVCFAIYHGRWPNGQIDHINRNPMDNRVCNLRECCQAENVRNHGRKTNNSGLPVGVRSLPSGKFQARISFNKKQIHLGAFNSPAEAHERYKQERIKLFKQFA